MPCLYQSLLSGYFPSLIPNTSSLPMLGKPPSESCYEGMPHLDELGRCIRYGILFYLISVLILILLFQTGRLFSKPSLNYKNHLLGFLQSRFFYMDTLWWASLEVGLELPISILGNISLFLLYLLVSRQPPVHPVAETESSAYPDKSTDF
ncbi:hypothetical protein CROQUDRAFT_242952 [Cronartium quercuum f. sp. fusiforme G11]|uniref:Uncharacterized protein n=1 Tax=Cronartium quercuum f. sp. fusiforme G11 TaxID=708437 RepID=A0A9P6T7N8_9BASI|nr:hypothetical protein CROQUDRAFT_242952 [Cronartium quercuum f. sp. fusiforme G11]